MSIDDIKALAALGATEVTIHPDGRIVAKFEKPAAPPVQYVPWPFPAVSPYLQFYGPWWSIEPCPLVTWGSADNQVPGIVQPDGSVTTANVSGVYEFAADTWVDPS
jgi:hypothetical protein